MKRIVAIVVFISLVRVVSGQGGLNVGDKVPVFTAVTDEDKLWSLADFLGKKNVVIYFYPAAMTGGCTKQACGYRDHLGDLDRLEAVVVGVSGDDVPSLRIFKKAQLLNFTLLSDHDGAIARLFGVPAGPGGTITRTIDSLEVVLNRGVTAQRWTFIVGKNGNILYQNQEVNAEQDYKAVLDALSNR